MNQKDGPDDGVDTGRRSLLAGAVVLAGGGSSASAQVPMLKGAPAISRRLPDVAVIGAGAFGGWAALSLREQGAKVTLIDAYGPGNPRASSGDESRLLRLSYGDREIYTRWAMRAAEAWSRRQIEFGRRLYYPNGSLRVSGSAQIAVQRAIFDRLGVSYEMLGPAEVRKRWPQINYDDTATIFYEHSGGVVKARESMIAVSEAFMHKGGDVRIGHATIGESTGGRLSGVKVDGDPLSAGAYVLACGPWLPKVLPHLLGDRIRVPRREIFYVGSPIDDHRYRWEHLPNLADSDTYTASDIDYGIKVAARMGDVASDPDDASRMPTSFLADQVKRYVARRMPGLADQPIVAVRVCQTEYSDNGHYIIDRHPEMDNVWIAGGGSGHAFKMGPVLGDYIRDRVMGRDPDPAATALFRLAAHGPAKPSVAE